jgi:hypothetical protein
MSPIHWRESRTIQGIVIAAVAQLLTWLGLHDSISTDDITINVGRLLDLISFAGMAWAAWNRARNPSPPLTQTAVERTIERERRSIDSPPKPQAGFVHPLMLAALLALGAVVVTVSGCTMLGIATPNGVEQRLAYAYGTHTGVQRSAAAALRGGFIDEKDAREVLRMADQARDLLDAARTLHNSGNSRLAGDKLHLAVAMLDSISVYLQERSKHP